MTDIYTDEWKAAVAETEALPLTEPTFDENGDRIDCDAELLVECAAAEFDYRHDPDQCDDCESFKCHRTGHPTGTSHLHIAGGRAAFTWV